AVYIAQWSRDEYTVTYQPGEHGTFEEQSTTGLHYGDTTPEGPDAANRHENGWTFLGWSPAVRTEVTGTITYVALWNQDDYAVVYQPGEHGTFEEQRTSGLHYGDATPEEPDAANHHEAGWSFTGWTPSVEETVNGNAVYTAQWSRDEYSVTYQPGEHGTFEEVAVPGLHYGDATPEEPDAGNNHEAGWKFIGWSPEVEATVSKTVTYVAQWEQEAYTVIYLPGRHGTFETTAVRDLHYGDTTPEAPDAMNQHEAGWSFAGWDPMPESTVSGNATYIAQWSQDEYTVIYQPGEHGTFEEASTPGLHYGDITPEGPNAAENHENGWSFTGWAPKVEDTVSGSATYVAQWSQDEYTVTYQPGEHGTFEEASTLGLHYGDTTPEGPNAAENHENGWSFTGWTPMVEDTVSGSATYVAQWSQDEYTVTYQPGEHGRFVEKSVAGLHYGDTTPEGPNAAENHENGWSFTGWAPMVEDTVSGNAIYVAQWSQDEYTVTYQPGEHGTFEEASTAELHYGDTTPEGPNAAENHEPGWSFTGWTPMVEDTVSGNATYVAQWSQDEYTVTYQPGAHGTFEEASILGLHYGDTTPEGPNAAENHENGWSFTGWAPSVEATVSGSVVYVAQWSRDEYTVTYQPGEHGTFEETSMRGLHYGDTTPEGPNAAENHENGWSFTGWAPKVEDTVSGSATYIAQWSQDEYTVTYQPGEHGTFEEASTAGLHYGDATPEGPNAAENHEPGWSFTGWTPMVEDTVSGSATYVAQWSQAEYTVTYQPGEHGTFAEASTSGLHYGDTTPKGPDAAENHEPGWSFTGWEPTVEGTVSGNAVYAA
ncbi:hypothetical protein DXA14_32635, partial [Hungatella hathewayi]